MDSIEKKYAFNFHQNYKLPRRLLCASRNYTFL